MNTATAGDIRDRRSAAAARGAARAAPRAAVDAGPAERTGRSSDRTLGGVRSIEATAPPSSRSPASSIAAAAPERLADLR